MTGTRLSMAILCFAGLGIAAGAADKTIWRLDAGADSSPVMDGYLRLTPAAAYTSEKGHGWESKGLEAFETPKTPDEALQGLGPGDQVIPPVLILHKEQNPLTLDGVKSKDDVVFRADVPNGTYRLALTLGNLDEPVCSMQVFINDVLVATDVDAKHFKRRGGADDQYGFPRKFRHTVEVRNGFIRIRLHGDDSGWKKRLEEEAKKPIPGSYLMNQPPKDTTPGHNDPAQWGLNVKQFKGGGDLRVWQDIGGPFTVNAVMGIEIYPFQKPPLWWEEGKLSATTPDSDLQMGADLFNQGKFPEAEKAFDRVKDDYGRALGWLWLAGRPQYEEEVRLAPQALEVLEKLAPSKKDDPTFSEVLEQARRGSKAIWRFEHRADEQRTYNELLMISGEASSLQPEDPLYYKSLIYAGRGHYMIIPHRWTFSAGAGRQLFEKLEQAGFADNRYVKWYLRNEWKSQPPDWEYPDYSAKRKGAPAWAAEIYEAYNRELDLGEWWITHRQAADGSLGGGWGDDVEILRGLGSFGAASRDASPVLKEGVRKVADGVWNSGSIDTEAGYFADVGDTEHSGEWTADPLTAMMRIDYGNPVYIERALKTGKLMRDVWMDTNAKGQFLMRSNFLGATGVGTGNTASDSRINGRPASPAREVLWYSNLPALQDLFLRWADAWLAASMSTERGKPKGVIPQEIGWADGLVGGINSPAWHTPIEEKGKTVNYEWGGTGSYLDYIVDLFMFAHEATGDPKCLEPMNLMAQFVEKNLPDEVKSAKGQAELQVVMKKLSEEKGDAWVAAMMRGWPKTWEKMRRVYFPEQFPEGDDLYTLAKIEEEGREELEMGLKRWPHATTECIATDRVGWIGLGNALRIMTAQGVMGETQLVSYRGLGRDIAAAVLRVDSSRLKAVVFNMDGKEREVAVAPWLLTAGEDYSFKGGPDANNDAKMDKAAFVETVKLKTRGQEFIFKLPARTGYVIEIARKSKGGKPELRPDLAISPEDFEVLKAWGRDDRNQVIVTVHNVGGTAAKSFEVALMEGGKEIGRQSIAGIEAPSMLVPQIVRVGFPYEPKGGKTTLTAVIDPEGKIEEITEANNTATGVLKMDAPKEKAKVAPAAGAAGGRGR